MPHFSDEEVDKLIAAESSAQQLRDATRGEFVRRAELHDQEVAAICNEFATMARRRGVPQSHFEERICKKDWLGRDRWVNQRQFGWVIWTYRSEFGSWSSRFWVDESGVGHGGSSNDPWAGDRVCSDDELASRLRRLREDMTRSLAGQDNIRQG